MGRSRLLLYGGVGAALAAAAPVAAGSLGDGPPDGDFHTVLEALAASTALFTGLVILLHHHARESVPYLLLGTGFLGTGILEGLHAAASWVQSGGLWSEPLSSLLPWTWLASRLYLALLMLLSWWAWPREERERRIPRKAVYPTAALVGLLILLFFALVPLPGAYFPELPLHRPQELLPALVFGAAAAGYLRLGRWRVDPVHHWIVLSLLIGTGLHLVYMPFSSGLYDGLFAGAHVLKLGSYACVLTGFSASMYRLFQEVESQAERLRSRNRELSDEIERRRHVEGELRKTVQEIESFNYSVSHDLRGPLRALDGFSEALMEDHREQLDEAAIGYLERIRRASRRMARLIDEMLSLSRLSRRGMAVRPLDLAALSREVFQELRKHERERDRKVEFTVEEGLHATGDPHLVRTVLQNLLENALKFTSRESRPRIDVGTVEEEGRRAFYVRDNGAGFDMAYADKLFGAFQRLHREEEFPGTGIGLATVQRIVHRHGGRVWAEASVDEGATFFFTLPTERDAWKGLEPPPAEPGP